VNESVAVCPAFGVYVTSLAVNATPPVVPWVTAVTVSVSPSGSESLNRTSAVMEPSLGAVIPSSFATGAELQTSTGWFPITGPRTTPVQSLFIVPRVLLMVPVFSMRPELLIVPSLPMPTLLPPVF